MTFLLNALLRSRDIMRDGDLYLRRYYLLRTRLVSVFIHYIARSDEDPFLHCHPWDFIAVLLSGSYVEEGTTGHRRIWPFIPRFRRAEHLHRLHLARPIWTLFIHFRRRRVWGFMTENGFVEHMKYFEQREKEQS